MSDAERIDELEMKISYLEDTIKQLDDEIYIQHQKIERLEGLCRRLLDDMKTASDEKPFNPANEIPPHF